MLKLLFWIGSLVVASNALAVGGCGPGSGGVPLVDISNHLSPHERVVKTDGGIKEFVLWEKTGKVAYRNQDDKIETTDLISGITKLLGSGGVPLAHLLDPENRFLLGQGTPWEFDSEAGGWYQYATDEARLKPLFWYQGYLYAARMVWDGWMQYVQIYAFNPEVGTAQRVCSELPAFSHQTGELKLAEGSHFPNIYLFTQAGIEVGGGMASGLGIGRVDLTSCDFEMVNQFPYVFYGPIQSVHMYDRLGSFSVKVNHPSYNLLWHQDYGSCRYYNIDNLTPFVLSENQPRIATFAPGEGLRVVDLNTQVEATVLKKLPVSDVSENDVWMTDDGTKLYAAPALTGQSARLLFELDVSSLQK